jgi:16S rRNA (cytosine967-C5)-methyltransferase
LPFFNEGFFIIQDEASQLVTSILDPKPGETILDGCAAPGGKTTHIAQNMGNQGEVYGLDLTLEKLFLIEEICKRLGIVIVKRLKGDATRSLPSLEGMKFDRVLADVPCSGFGTLRKNPDLKWRKGEEDIKRLSELQTAILNNLSGYVKSGGVLVYSTCTVFCEENENVIETFLTNHPEFNLDSVSNLLPKKFNSLIRNGYLKTFPSKDEMDGFFVARLIRKN